LLPSVVVYSLEYPFGQFWPAVSLPACPHPLTCWSEQSGGENETLVLGKQCLATAKDWCVTSTVLAMKSTAKHVTGCCEESYLHPSQTQYSKKTVFS